MSFWVSLDVRPECQRLKAFCMAFCAAQGLQKSLALGSPCLSCLLPCLMAVRHGFRQLLTASCASPPTPPLPHLQPPDAWMHSVPCHGASQQSRPCYQRQRQWQRGQAVLYQPAAPLLLLRDLQHRHLVRLLLLQLLQLLKPQLHLRHCQPTCHAERSRASWSRCASSSCQDATLLLLLQQQLSLAVKQQTCRQRGS